MTELLEICRMRAIGRLGTTEAERAARLSYPVRAVDYWAEGKGLAATLQRLEGIGLIRIVDAEEPTSPRPIGPFYLKLEQWDETPHPHPRHTYDGI